MDLQINRCTVIGEPPTALASQLEPEAQLRGWPTDDVGLLLWNQLTVGWCERHPDTAVIYKGRLFVLGVQDGELCSSSAWHTLISQFGFSNNCGLRWQKDVIGLCRQRWKEYLGAPHRVEQHPELRDIIGVRGDWDLTPHQPKCNPVLAC